jgi:LDH2 family malate/lactate/ureidoglycolate dehydrogenase
MMDVLAGVLTGSHFGSQITGPYQADQRSGCGHMLLTIDVQSMLPLKEFEARMESLIDEIKAVPTAAGTDEIFFPGELEDRHALICQGKGITLAELTWQSLAKLGDETGVAMPKILTPKEMVS